MSGNIHLHTGIVYAYMNKTHWNTVTPGGEISADELKRMVENSCNLIKPKVRKPK